MKFEEALNEALDRETVMFGGFPAVVLHQDSTYKYLLQDDEKKAAELRPGDYVAVDNRPARVKTEPKPADFFMKRAGETVKTGQGLQPDYVARPTGGRVRFRVMFLDVQGGETVVTEKGSEYFPLVTLVKQGFVPQTGRQAKPMKTGGAPQWLASSEEELPQV